MKDSAQNQ